jgi:hypothetical protein
MEKEIFLLKIILRRHKMKLIATVAAIALLGACGSNDEASVQFSGTSTVAKPKNPVEPKSDDLVVEAPPEEVESIVVADDIIVAEGESTEFFFANKIEQEINLVWVVDNSYSMDDENATVRRNLSDFADELSDSSNLNMALIGGPELGGIDFGDNYVEHVITNVGSYDSLQMVSAALCDKSSSQGQSAPFKDYKVCGKNVSGKRHQANYISNVNGKLNGFFKEHAKNIVVIVSDDDASGIDEDNFLSTLKGNGITNDIKLYGFIGKSRSSRCDMATRGTSYEKIAEKTGGATYDICGNWSESFEDLTKSVLTIERRPIKLEKKPSKINWVKIGDKVLHHRQYYISRGNVVVIKGYDLEEEAGDISINYEW